MNAVAAMNPPTRPGFAKPSRRGFTLIELLVVIAIIGIIMSLVIAASRFARVKATTGRARADLEQIANALNNYMVENGIYPANLNGLPLPSNMDLTDPWGNPYVYTRGAGNVSFALYSRGPHPDDPTDDIHAGRF